MKKSIEQYLSACMAASRGRIGVFNTEFLDFRMAVQASPGFRADVAANLSDPAIESRDHLVKWRNDLLRRVLGATNV